jgi:secreted trypsin-like serine protease
MKSHLLTAAVVVSLSITFPTHESKADGFTPSDFQKMFALSRDASKKHAALMRQLFPRIIGGVNANPGEFPHQVSLMFSSKFDPSPGLDRHFCGGSIRASSDRRNTTPSAPATSISTSCRSMSSMASGFIQATTAKASITILP